jgi:hypothetical protein
MHDQPQTLTEGAVYLDFDGTPVTLVRIVGQICCWIYQDKDWNERQYILAEHFARRFRRVPDAA